jgi:hypothetical protein
METGKKLANRDSAGQLTRHRSHSRNNNRVLIIAAVIGALGAVVAAAVTVILPHLMAPGGHASSSARRNAPSATSSQNSSRHGHGTSPSGRPGSGSGMAPGRSHGTSPGPTPTAAPSAQSSAPPSATYPETVGGPTHTWTDYEDAGGTEGKTIRAFLTVQVSCRVRGFKVQDGDTWWYRIASSPWSNGFYASADAFYNNGQTFGSLIGTPPVDTKVPEC